MDRDPIQTMAEVIVTDHKSLDRLLAGMRPTLARTVLASLTERVAGYEQLPSEALAGDIRHVIEINIGLFVDALRTGRVPEPDDLAVLRESAGRRAEEGIPVEQVLDAYHVGVQVVWDELLDVAGPDDEAALASANRLMLRYLQRVSAAVSVGYLEQRQAMSGDEQADRQALLSALLDGGSAADAAHRAGVPLPACYAVLALAIGPHADEAAAGVDPAVAARRKLRRFRAELDRRAGHPVLARLGARGGTALLPLTVPPEDVTGAHDRWLAELVAGGARAAGVQVGAGAVPAVPGAVAAAARLAREVLDVAVAFGRAPGVHRLDDVLVEYQLSRPGAARARLAALLAPLDAHPQLLDTLTAHLAAHQQRRRTAEVLHVHPNTVDYRLRRIALLTGLDPNRAADTTRIEAALAARTMDRR